MANKIASSIQGQAIRVTKVDDCGVPIEGPCSFATSDGFISLDLAADIEEGETFEVKNANGELCISEVTCPELKAYDLSMTLCGIDPELIDLLTSYEVVNDRRGDSVGYQATGGVICAGNFALEIWTKVAGDKCDPQTCGPDENEQWFYWLLPRVNNGILGDFTIENGPLEVSFTARSKAPNKWGQGPYSVVCLDATPPTGGAACVAPGPLFDEPVLTNTHLYKRLTGIQPPTIECGCQTLTAVPPLTALP